MPCISWLMGWPSAARAATCRRFASPSAVFSRMQGRTAPRHLATLCAAAPEASRLRSPISRRSASYESRSADPRVHAKAPLRDDKMRGIAGNEDTAIAVALRDEQVVLPVAFVQHLDVHVEIDQAAQARGRILPGLPVLEIHHEVA